MKRNSMKSDAAMRARMRRLRAKYRNRTIIVSVILFFIGVALGILANRWYARLRSDAVVSPAALEVTAQPTPDVRPPEEVGWLDGAEDDIFPEEEIEPEGDDEAVMDAFPEVSPEQIEGEDDIFPEDEPEETAVEAAEAPVEGEAPEQAEAPVEGEAPAEAEVPPEAEAPVEGEVPAEGEAPAEAEVPVEGEAAVEAEVPAEAEVPVEGEAPAGAEVPVEGEAAVEAEVPPEAEVPVEGEAAAEGEAPEEPEATVDPSTKGPQVVAIVPYGESFTYTTQVKQDGTARVEATDEPYESVSFTQTMKSLMRPTDFASKYSTQYKLQGNEAGAGFELILKDYTGNLTIIPQNVIDVSLRSESGETIERGYQLMDAEIAGNYGIALTTNTPMTLYKRYQYSTVGEEMAYLVVTTYNDGDSQMILFELESDEPEPTPEPVYNILQRGVISDEVANMQARLIALGYMTGTADGAFGAMTEEAIKKAQEAFGMEVNGIADNAFQRKLYEGADPESIAITYTTLKLNDIGDNVINMQRRLSELGFYDGKADGGFGAMTEGAVKKAQEAFGLEANGVADNAFLQMLYASAAPTPVPPADEGAAPTPEAEPTSAPTEAAANTVG